MRKVGIMGGTFNPIHNGHLMIAEAALRQASLEKVVFMPCGIPYLKAGIPIADGSDRAEMTRLAIQYNNSFELSTWELEQPGNTYTANTLVHLNEKNPDTEYYFIVGADSLFGMADWKSPEIIFSNCHVLAAVRDDKSAKDMFRQIAELKQRFCAKIDLLYTECMDVSSSAIREKIRCGESVDQLLPGIVQEYIRKTKLYQD